MSKTAILEIDGQKYEFPLIEGTENEVAVDIAKLRGATGAITIDPGYKNTGSCTSAITFLDGEKGILRYRGYSIEDLAGQSNFLEVSYLLVFGELPTATELEKFENDIIEKIKSEKPEIIDAIQSSGKLEENTEKLLEQAIEEYKKANK